MNGIKLNRRFFHAGIFVAAILATGHLRADVSISQIPLFVIGGVSPNLMFVLDDSGSMTWGFMPDDLVDRFSVSEQIVYYYRNSIGDCDGGVFWFGDDRLCARGIDNVKYLASPKLNNQYFDPGKTYTPPPKADESRYPSVDFNKAPINGYDTNPDEAEYVNLSTNYRAVMDDYYYYGDCGYNCEENGFSISPNGEAGAAFYYEYDAGKYGCGSVYDDACYESVSPIPDAEKQNFANWFSYYRTRMMTAKAGVGIAFSEQPESLRVGFGTLNQGFHNVDGQNTGTLRRGVRNFQGDDRGEFFRLLYASEPGGSTPLRGALKDVGEYYERSDSQGPWSSTPGSGGGSDYACRRSFSVLMTDGYYGGNSPGVGNTDNEAGQVITGPGGKSYQYDPAVTPLYRDGHSNTLADVAMDYWKRDLRTDMDNIVGTDERDPAFWQHMVTYGVGLGVDGSLPSIETLAKEPDETVDWPDPNSGNSAKIDDLLHAAVNGRGEFFGADDPETFTREMTSMLSDIVNRGTGSSSSIAANSTRLDTDSAIYQALFDSDSWEGDLISYEVNTDGEIEGVGWKAASQLDKASDDDIMNVNGSREIYTYFDDPTDNLDPVLTEFFWNNLSADQKDALDGADNNATLGQQRVRYLRGDRRLEQRNGGAFRNRDSRLGDIINSNPAFSGSEGYGYQLLPNEAGRKYTTYLDDKENRNEMIYVGANDGMLHAFDADDGDEVFAYIPSMLFDKLPALTDPNYAHSFYVDGAPIVTDAYIGGGWKTILIGSLNAGGKGLFALDISNPDNPTLMWEFTHPELGEGVKEVSVVPVNESASEWHVVFGNGYNSDSGKAALFALDLSDGSLVGDAPVMVGASTENGMAGVTAINSGDGYFANVIYAGDLRGNLWKFEPGNNGWKSAFGNTNSPDPMFIATDGSNRQPITSRPEVTVTENDQNVVVFGTGKYLENGDVSDTSVQSLYGIFDDDLKGTVSRGDLLEQRINSEGELTISGESRPYRIFSDNEISDGDAGWRIDLISPNTGSEGERVVVRPTIRGEAVVFVSLIPSASPCDGGGSSWLIAISKNNGGQIDGGVIDVNEDGKIDEEDYVNDGGVKVPASSIGFDSILSRVNFISGAANVDQGYGSTSDGDIARVGLKGLGGLLGRQSWRQLR
ncbi:pilus assembly protein [Alloalcanivorax venustensis]|jgi:type IV pilus assembly protein PilY1|uniref:pilus assembly protein n=1 Tax=Alloalcanivorax venustensis TaxID=172371 RepID=UPI0035130FC9|tara:strand:+ start:2227 stop:5685 length:3459 start_codon:yes stop_codon:yes gene_type:complete